MSKAQVSYQCDDCGGHSLKWQGQCPACGAWNTLRLAQQISPARVGYAGEAQSRRLSEVDETGQARQVTGISELFQCTL